MRYDKYVIGENIRTLRRTSNLTQKELAEKIGVKYQNLGAWERGKHIPPTKYILLLAAVLNVSIEQLMNGNSKKETFNPMQKAIIKNLIEESPSFQELHALFGLPTQTVYLEFPWKPEDLTDSESLLWDSNELALHRWEKTKWAFNAPPWILERFCREAVDIYKGDELQAITGILKSYIKEERP